MIARVIIIKIGVLKIINYINQDEKINSAFESYKQKEKFELLDFLKKYYMSDNDVFSKICKIKDLYSDDLSDTTIELLEKL